MNDFQKERDKLLSKRGLSDQQKRAVIEKVRTKEPKNNKWAPAVAVVGVLAAGSFLLLSDQESEPFVTSEKEQVQPSETYAQSFLNYNHKQQAEVLHEKRHVLLQNDHFIIVKDIVNGETQYHFAFGHYNAEQKKWEHQDHVVLTENYLPTLTRFSIGHGQMIVGAIRNEQVETIEIGNEEATVVQTKAGQRLWYSVENSYVKPVYEVINGQKQRLAGEFNTRIDSVVPIIEPVNSSLQTIHYEKNTMHRGNEEYTQFPVIIDPYYYAQESYQVGDVIAYEQDGVLEISRILGTSNNEIELIEDTLVNVGNDQEIKDRFYTWPTYDGDTGIYKGLSKEFDKPTRDEVLVIPDNWASDGYQGIINKEQIVGAVLGYDLTQLTHTLTDDELTLFKQLQRNRTTIDALVKDVSVNTVVRLYLYANYVDDYEVMYALLDKTADVPAFEQWQQQVEKTSKQHLLKDIYQMGLAQLTKDASKLRFTDPVSEHILRQYKVSRTDMGWKVIHSLVSGN
ncbi:MAG: hypothetical protein ABS942_04190 [Solibacillus sp.]